MAPRYKLKLKQLDFISLVDDPAQPNAKCLLIKRRTGTQAADVQGTARLVKTIDELGLAFFWAFTSTNTDGTDHYDLHGDQVVADDAMIKAAMSFMESGGAVDEMHDEEPDGGRVVFAMPMTPEIAKAFGVTTKTNGLMIAIKPSADAMAKLKDGTYRAVSIAGLGEREQLEKSAGRVVKGSLYTNEVDGHQHKICVYEDGSMYVESATSEGATQWHSHGIVFEDGQLTILADSGHTHELAAGQGGVVAVPADAIVIVQASARPTTNSAGANNAANKSTQTIGTQHRGLTQGEPMSNTPDFAKQLADVTKQLDQATKLATLTDAQRAYHKSKSGADADAFLNKSHDEREAVIAAVESANPVEYTSKSTGRSFRRSELTSDLCIMSKKLDEQSEALSKRDEAIEKADIRKRATETIGKLAGGDAVHDLIVRSVLKSGASAEEIGAALTAMKGWNELGKSANTTKGSDGYDASGNASGMGDPYSVFKAEVAKFGDKNGIKDHGEATTKFLATNEGKVAKRAYDATRGYAPKQ